MIRGDRVVVHVVAGTLRSEQVGPLQLALDESQIGGADVDHRWVYEFSPPGFALTIPGDTPSLATIPADMTGPSVVGRTVWIWCTYDPAVPAADNPHGQVVETQSRACQVALDEGLLVWVSEDILTLE